MGEKFWDLCKDFLGLAPKVWTLRGKVHYKYELLVCEVVGSVRIGTESNSLWNPRAHTCLTYVSVQQKRRNSKWMCWKNLTQNWRRKRKQKGSK